MTESSESFDVTLSPSRLLHGPAYGVAMMLAALALFSSAFWALSTLASGLPEPVGIGLMLISLIAFYALTGYAYNYVYKRQLANNMRTLRFSPTRIEYFGRGLEILGCDRASLRVRRLRYVHPIPDEDSRLPDSMAIELSGPGLRPLVLYKHDTHSHEMWKQIDEVIHRLPEFTINKHDWTNLRAALGLEH